MNRIFIIAIALQAAAVAGLIYLGVMLAGEIQEHGLKGIVDEIWYGEQK